MEHERMNSGARFEGTPPPDTEKTRDEYRTIGDKTMQIAAQADSSTAEKVEQKPAPAKTSHLGNVFVGDLVVPVQGRVPVALTMADFADLYKASKIDADTRKAEELRRKFELRESDSKTGDFYAKRFEQKLVIGIQAGRWLGNVGDSPDFTTISHISADYDDYIHRLDVFTAVNLKEPIVRERKNKEPLRISQIPIAFDATVSTSSAKIEEKLTKMSNAGTDVPFGFTQIDYYTDNRRKKAVEYCPRYVIGISSRETKDCVNDKDLKDMSCEPNANNLTMRFKVLSEMRAQNRLFQAMLPAQSAQEPDRHKRVIRRNARLMLERMEEILTSGLDECAGMILNPASRVLDERTRGQIEAAEDKVSAIEEEMIKGSKMKFMLDYENILSEDYNPNDPNEEDYDTYSKIVLTAKALTELAKNTHQLDQYKTIGKHHQAF